MHPSLFKEFKLDRESLQKYWTSKGNNTLRDKLRGLIRQRNNDGIDSGLRDHRIFWAIDLAYDAPFNQLAPTIVKDILTKHANKDTQSILDVLKQWNINIDDVMCRTVDAQGNERIIIDAPMFFQVVFPLVKAYVTIRRAKLFNDRNIFPFLKYEPIKFTLQNRIIGEIITDLVQQICQQYGYPAILKQVILQVLQYGTCLMFPMEEWHRDEAYFSVDGKSKKLTVKEGLRYCMPHPTLSFWDKNHRPSTFNTDSGCEFAGYWKVDRFSTVEDNPHYWNKDSVAMRGNNWMSSYPTYFQEVAPCVLKIPSKWALPDGDRQREVEYYSTNDRDSAIFLTEMFCKLIPSHWGLGTYEHPLWMRFVLAGSDTVIWNSPMCFNPVLYAGYDSDEQKARNSSMALEVLPGQDHFGILCSQYIYSVKQNLSKAVFFDTDQVDQKHVDQLANLGVRRYAATPFIPFSSRAAKIAGHERADAFIPINFPFQDTASIASAMTTIIGILERILVLSSQEIGQAASHEQTAQETQIIAAHTSTRVTFTGSFIDDFIDGWKRQLYDAIRAYLPDEVTAQASINVPGSQDVLNDLGFTIEDDKGTSESGRVKAVVKGKLSKLSLDAFISTREGESRINGTAIAGAMSNLLQVAMANPVTASAIGAEQALDMITEIGKLAGMPKEFQLKVAKGATDEEKQKMVGEELQKLSQQIAQAAVQASVQESQKEIGEPLAEQLQQTNQVIGQVNQKTEETAQVLAALIQKMQPLLAALEQAAAQPQAPPNAPAPAEPALA